MVLMSSSRAKLPFFFVQFEAQLSIKRLKADKRKNNIKNQSFHSYLFLL